VKIKELPNPISQRRDSNGLFLTENTNKISNKELDVEQIQSIMENSLSNIDCMSVRYSEGFSPKELKNYTTKINFEDHSHSEFW